MGFECFRGILGLCCDIAGLGEIWIFLGWIWYLGVLCLGFPGLRGVWTLNACWWWLDMVLDAFLVCD